MIDEQVWRDGLKVGDPVEVKGYAQATLIRTTVVEANANFVGLSGGVAASFSRASGRHWLHANMRIVRPLGTEEREARRAGHCRAIRAFAASDLSTVPIDVLERVADALPR